MVAIGRVRISHSTLAEMPNIKTCDVYGDTYAMDLAFPRFSSIIV